MEAKFFVLIAVVLAATFVLGCIGEKESTETATNTMNVSNGTKIADTTPEKVIYTCPLDGNKISYNCETDADCKMVTCRSGAGDVETCVNVDSEYQGVQSDLCACKVVGTAKTFENGIETVKEIKECRHI